MVVLVYANASGRMVISLIHKILMHILIRKVF
jgi:hypothetical protein